MHKGSAYHLTHKSTALVRELGQLVEEDSMRHMWRATLAGACLYRAGACLYRIAENFKHISLLQYAAAATIWHCNIMQWIHSTASLYKAANTSRRVAFNSHIIFRLQRSFPANTWKINDILGSEMWRPMFWPFLDLVQNMYFVCFWYLLAWSPQFLQGPTRHVKVPEKIVFVLSF